MEAQEGRTVTLMNARRRVIWQLRLSEAAYQHVQELARERECSIPDVIRHALTRYLAAVERSKGANEHV